MGCYIWFKQNLWKCASVSANSSFTFCSLSHFQGIYTCSFVSNCRGKERGGGERGSWGWKGGRIKCTREKYQDFLNRGVVFRLFLYSN